MSEHVWVSNILNDPKLIVMFLTDLGERDERAAIEGVRAWKRGESVPIDLLPTQIFPEREYATIADGKNLPDVFVAEGYWIVSEKAADILRQFDLGGGALYPVQVASSDRKRSFSGNWFGWIFGNVKDAFLADHSQNLRPFGMTGAWMNMPLKPQDWDISVTDRARVGPDVWLDFPLNGALFLSGPLGDALKGAKLAKSFRLSQARLIKGDEDRPS